MTELPATGGRNVHTVRFPAAAPPATVDVLVVGAGPVGLAAAVELTSRDVRVAVVDRARTATLVRAGAMGHTSRVVEHLRRWGLLQRVRDAWTYPPEWHRGTRLVTSLAGHELVPVAAPSFTTKGSASGHSADEALRRPQTVFQRVFLDHLTEQGVRVSGGWELTALREDEDGVDAEVVDVNSGRTHTIRAAYVLGTDGGGSTTRRLAGIDRTGEHAGEKRLRLIVRTGDISDRVGPAPSATNIVINSRASGFLAAVSAREWRVYAGPYPLEHEPSEGELLDIGRAAFGLDIDLELVSATTFYHATRIAEAFRRGPVLLAGDAAHVCTPGGNLGEGIGDVVNLGWKLAAVLDGHAPPSLLDSYDQERRPHNWRVAEHSLERARRSQATLAEIRAGGIPDDADLGDEAVRRRAEIGARLRRDRFGSDGVAFDERYDASAVVWYEPGQLDTEPPWRADVYEDDPRPGHRAPDGASSPGPGDFNHRVWQGVFSAQGAEYAAQSGSNLLLNRATYGFDAPTDEVQRPWYDAYLAAWDLPHHPRIGLSRFVFPAKDRRTALAAIGDDVHRAALRMAEHGAFPKGLDADEALRRFHSFYGHPEEIVAALGQEKVLPVATDLITQFSPAVPDHDAAVRALELIATEVAPALGWQPARPAEPVSAGV